MASPFQLARSGGRLRTQVLKAELDTEIREYVEELEKYRTALKQWDNYGRILTKPVPPEVPYYLNLWFELQRWPGTLLVDGGLWDQPHWTWQMVDLAGRYYRDVQKRNQAAVEEEPKNV